MQLRPRASSTTARLLENSPRQTSPVPGGSHLQIRARLAAAKRSASCAPATLGRQPRNAPYRAIDLLGRHAGDQAAAAAAKLRLDRQLITPPRSPPAGHVQQGQFARPSLRETKASESFQVVRLVPLLWLVTTVRFAGCLEAQTAPNRAQGRAFVLWLARAVGKAVIGVIVSASSGARQ